VELVLYVAARSAASLRARANLEALLAGYDRSRVRLQVKDVADAVQDAEEDHIVFTPTLIVRARGLEARAVGDLGDAAATAGLLNIGGLEKTG
jgi:hypothetical protein